MGRRRGARCKVLGARCKVQGASGKSRLRDTDTTSIDANHDDYSEQYLPRDNMVVY